MAVRSVSLVLVGIGGMGAVYVDELLKNAPGEEFTIAGLVDPAPERCPRLDALRAAGVPVLADLGAFYKDRTADLAVISSPHHFHAPQTLAALDGGSHVLCEKPAAATIQDTRSMADAEIRTGRWAAIAYQWSFSEAVQALKADILAGRFGRPPPSDLPLYVAARPRLLRPQRLGRTAAGRRRRLDPGRAGQ